MPEMTSPGGLPILGAEELDAHRGTPLPDRTAMTTIHVELGFPIDNFAMPINLATAVNHQSPDSWAVADADQIVIVDQVDDDGMAPPPRYRT
jgi:hypothetical protein